MQGPGYGCREGVFIFSAGAGVQGARGSSYSGGVGRARGSSYSGAWV